MKKKLLILSSIMAIGITTTANFVNIEETNNLNTSLNLKQQNCHANEIYSIDFVKYDKTPDEIINLQLPDLLNIFKKLNQFHKDNNVEIKLSGVPTWYIRNDAGQIPIRKGASDILNIYYLINSNFVEFKSAWMKISNKEIQGYLSYKISDIEQSIELFKANSDNIPNKQEHMLVSFGIPYIY